MSARTGIRYLESSRGWEVYAIPSCPVFTERRSALEALYRYQHDGIQYPSVYDLLMAKIQGGGGDE